MTYLQGIPEQNPGGLSEPPLDANGSTRHGCCTLVTPGFWWQTVKETNGIFLFTSLKHFASREAIFLSGGTLCAHDAGGEETEKKSII